MAKRPVPRYDFKAFGAAIKVARLGRKESRKKVCDYQQGTTDKPSITTNVNIPDNEKAAYRSALVTSRL